MGTRHPLRQALETLPLWPSRWRLVIHHRRRIGHELPTREKSFRDNFRRHVRVAARVRRKVSNAEINVGLRPATGSLDSKIARATASSLKAHNLRRTAAPCDQDKINPIPQRGPVLRQSNAGNSALRPRLARDRARTDFQAGWRRS